MARANALLTSKESYVQTLILGLPRRLGEHLTIDLTLLLYHMEVPVRDAARYLNTYWQKVAPHD